MTIPKILIVVFLLFLPMIGLLGYLGHIYLPETPVKASSVAVEPRTTQIWRITAYCKENCCCGKWADGITASGAKAEGKLIAAPKEIPFGTWIDIPGYGMAEVLDRGGAMKGRRLDILFNDNNDCTGHQKALEWGVRYLELDIKY